MCVSQLVKYQIFVHKGNDTAKHIAWKYITMQIQQDQYWTITYKEQRHSRRGEKKNVLTTYLGIGSLPRSTVFLSPNNNFKGTLKSTKHRVL